MVKDNREDICIYFISRYTKILKELVEECRGNYLRNIDKRITVFENREGDWKKTRLRPIRPISTVIMDKQIQNEGLKDMKNFLNAGAQKWYAERVLIFYGVYVMSIVS